MLATVRACVCMCVNTSQAVAGRELPRHWCCRLETCSTILSATSEPSVNMTYIYRGSLCAKEAPLNGRKKTQSGGLKIPTSV